MRHRGECTRSSLCAVSSIPPHPLSRLFPRPLAARRRAGELRQYASSSWAFCSVGFASCWFASFACECCLADVHRHIERERERERETRTQTHTCICIYTSVHPASIHPYILIPIHPEIRTSLLHTDYIHTYIRTYVHTYIVTLTLPRPHPHSHSHSHPHSHSRSHSRSHSHSLSLSLSLLTLFSFPAPAMTEGLDDHV